MNNIKNEEYYLQEINISTRRLKDVPKEFRDDKYFLMKAINLIKKDWFYLFACVSPEVMYDKELVLKIVEKNPMSVMYISELLKEDKEIALTALKINKDVFYCLGFNLKEELRHKGSLDDKISYLEKFVLKDKLSENLPIQKISIKKTKI